jgi:hypothetical protein
VTLPFQNPGDKPCADWTHADAHEGGIKGLHCSSASFPFVVTPTNIIQKGVRRTPLGTASLVYKAARGRLSPKETLTQVAEQVIAWGAMAAVYSLANRKGTDGMRLSLPARRPVHRV